MSKKILLKPYGGLCNRLGSIDSCISLAQKHGRELYVFWEENSLLNCSFDRLFQPNEHFILIPDSRKRIRHLINSAMFPSNIDQFTIFKKMMKRRVVNQYEISKFIYNPQLQALYKIDGQDRNPDYSLDEYYNRFYKNINPLLEAAILEDSFYVASCFRLFEEKHLYRSFIPIGSIQDKIDSLSDNFENVIGLHIRQTDLKVAIVNSTMEKFEERINGEIEKNENVKFFLATDSQKVESALIAKYPGRIIKQEISSYSRNVDSGIQDAVVDLFCLSRTKKIYGSVLSTFSYTASKIGGIELVPVK